MILPVLPKNKEPILQRKIKKVKLINVVPMSVDKVNSKEKMHKPIISRNNIKFLRIPNVTPKFELSNFLQKYQLKTHQLKK